MFTDPQADAYPLVPATPAEGDSVLLQSWAVHASNAAFRQLTDRYIKLVFSIALRGVAGRRELAEEVTQNVFALLARKAGRLNAAPSISGWLYQTTVLEAKSAARRELKRLEKMKHFSEAESDPADDQGDPWAEALPRLDDAMNALSQRERELLLLRFYEGRGLRDIATSIGQTEASVQRQAHRALEKLRRLLGRRGDALPAACVASGLTAQLTQAAPAGLANSIAQSALIAAKTLSSITILTNTLLTMSHVKLISLAAVVVLAVVPAAYQWGAQGAVPPPELLAKLSHLETTLAQKQTELSKLQASARQSVDKSPAKVRFEPAKAKAPVFSLPVTPTQLTEDRQKKLKEAVEVRLQARVEEQLAILKQRLGLNDAQCGAMRTLLRDKVLNGDFTLRTMLGGQDKKDVIKDMTAMITDPMKREQDADAKLLALLTPAQREAFAAHKQEERVNSVEMATTKELAKIQGAMSLTPEQKDQIFASFSQITDAEFDRPITGAVAMLAQQAPGLTAAKSGSGDGASNGLLKLADEMKQRQVRRREALMPILSEEQLKVYDTLPPSHGFSFGDLMSETMDMMLQPPK